MPTSWALQELEVHSLTTNTTIASKHIKGDSMTRSIWAGMLSRNVSTQVNGAIQRAPDWDGPKFWFTNIKDKSAMELLGALSLKGEKRLAKSLPSKGAGCSKGDKSQKSDKAQRKRGVIFREIEICLEVQQEIDMV